MRKLLLGMFSALVAATFLLAPLPASANTYHVVYSAPGGNSGYLDLVVGGTTVTGISGLSNGSPIVGLSSYAGADQQWFATSPHVSFAGLAWATSVDAFGLGWLGTEYGLAVQSLNPSGAPPGFHPLDLSVAETPLPATLPLFVTGLGGLGLLLHRRKKKAPARALSMA